MHVRAEQRRAGRYRYKRLQASNAGPQLTLDACLCVTTHIHLQTALSKHTPKTPKTISQPYQVNR